MMGNCMNMMDGMGSMMGGGMMGGMMLWSLLSTLAVIALVVGGVVLLVRALAPQRFGRSSGALAILQERFARGEIDREEYQERSRLLQSQP